MDFSPSKSLHNHYQQSHKNYLFMAFDNRLQVFEFPCGIKRYVWQHENKNIEEPTCSVKLIQ